MQKLVSELVRQFSSPRVWVEQTVWSIILAVIARFFFWLSGVAFDPTREIGFWLGVPVIAALGFSVLRSLGGYADLRAAIEQVSTLKGEDGSDAIAITCSIRNMGRAPSAATHWRAEIQIAGSPVVHKQLTPIEFPGLGLAYMDKNGTPFLIRNTELMHNKGSQGVPGGGYIAGLVVCLVPDGVKPEEVLRAGTRVALTFQDVTGRLLRTDHIVSGVIDSVQKWIPGIERLVGIPDGGATPTKQLPSGTGRAKKGNKRRGKNTKRT